MDIHTATEEAYKRGFEAGKNYDPGELIRTLNAVKTVIEYCDKHDKSPLTSWFEDEEKDGFHGDIGYFYEGLDNMQEYLEKKSAKKGDSDA